MPLLRITNGFDQLADIKLFERASFIHQQMSLYATVFPSPTPSMPLLKTTIDEYQAALTTAGDRGRTLITHKNVLREQLIDLLHNLGYYVLYIAQGDRQIAMQSGFTLAKEPTRRVFAAPANLQLTYTSQIGEMLVRVKAVRGSGSYIYRYTADATQKVESWQNTSCTSAKCKITGLTPGTLYYFCVGLVGSNDQVLYSNVRSKMAV
ncbi:MAG: fibronectin type III domain-containing protein [Chitinophagaceae bacterium]|nr:MAG: fibronectin type III domain-containing protein [Chitinophagaceae bacterium]